jgi:hypothetical protein
VFIDLEARHEREGRQIDFLTPRERERKELILNMDRLSLIGWLRGHEVQRRVAGTPTDEKGRASQRQQASGQTGVRRLRDERADICCCTGAAHHSKDTGVGVNGIDKPSRI